MKRNLIITAVIRPIGALLCLLLLLSYAKGQTYITGPLTTSTLAPGNYYNSTQIVFGTGFSANGATGPYQFSIIPDCAPFTNNFSQGLNYILTISPRG